ncbi:MAG: RNA methyltransferase [Proteobacteria bacterium]|nr:RNA methyltransferase [Pseudomonadota bacterium]
MEKLSRLNLSLALVHYPVANKKGEEICSAVTNLDLHDIARAARTYGVNAYYVVTPLEDQKILVERISSHWTTGNGGKVNPARAEALRLINVKHALEDVVLDIRQKGNGVPKVVVTTAKKNSRMIRYEAFREIMKNGEPYLLAFGTAWGLSEEIIKTADYVLEPLDGNTGYNHLSVRSAVSIILDRLAR